MGADGSAARQAGAGLRGSRPGPVHEDAVGPAPDGPRLGWIGPRPFTPDEADRLSEAARFAAAPLAALGGARHADGGARGLSRPAQRGARACRSAAARRRRDDRGGASVRRPARLHRACPKAPRRPRSSAALDAWFDRIAGAVHAFGGEVLKFMGDGVLAIFPVLGGSPRNACDAALKAVAAARSGMAHLDEARRRDGLQAPALRRRAAFGRDAVGQYRRRRPAGFHRNWPRRQSGQSFAGPMPAARPRRPRLGRLRRRNRHAPLDPARDARSARHRRAVRGVYRGGVTPPVSPLRGRASFRTGYAAW